ncbi:MAG TPA: formylglycine-generating enzyme family protein [Myxococcaceae bacterium]|nr:formylglycine-generating enzyme family protein [Myxococcaceae bacterium]
MTARNTATLVLLLSIAAASGCYQIKPLPPGATLAPPSPFDGAAPGELRVIAGVRMRWCPAGTFVMGSPPGEPERRPGEDQVEVMISKGFWAGEREVTQGEWRRVAGAPPEPPFAAGEGDDFPMYRIDFAEAEDFASRLTALARASTELPEDWEIRLPTEAQWEYMARAGTTAPSHLGAQWSSAEANFLGTPYGAAAEGPAIDQTVPVASYAPNPWGLFDTCGNVNEWCRDWVHERLPGGVDPDLHDVLGEPNRDGTYPKARRGGCFADPGWACRVAFRQRFEPERRHEHIGMRVVAVRP